MTKKTQGKSRPVAAFVLLTMLQALFGTTSYAAIDSDGDGVFDAVDNCIDTFNPEQIDADLDGFGNICDADIDGDCVVNAADLGQLRLAFFSDDAVSDFNSDGVVNFADLGVMRNNFFAEPGPSGLRGCAIVEERFPRNFELYPRNLDTNLAFVPVTGEADPGVEDVQLTVFRDGVIWTQLTKSVASSPIYAFSVPLPAELANYEFWLASLDDMGEVVGRFQAVDVVAGDVYVINGQSNAVAATYNGSNAEDVNPFVRTFGGWGVDDWVDNQDWYVGRANCTNDFGCIGQWGLRFAATIVNTEQTPVAMINGGRDGQRIAYFQRNDLDPTDLSTNYGRLLMRLNDGGIADHIRALFWYQGESDRLDSSGHIEGFEQLHSDWLESYPSVEQFYVFQIRTACSFGQAQRTSNAQREFANQTPGMTAVSTTGLDGHDGCHYAYVDGYQTMGDNLARIVRSDLYDGPILNAEAPDITLARRIDASTIELTFSANNALIADPGFEALFELRTVLGSVDIPILSGTVMPDSTVTLTTTAPVPAGTNLTLSYISLTGDQNWLTNEAGIGILSFDRVPIEPLM